MNDHKFTVLLLSLFLSTCLLPLSSSDLIDLKKRW